MSARGCDLCNPGRRRAHARTPAEQCACVCHVLEALRDPARTEADKEHIRGLWADLHPEDPAPWRARP